MVGSKMVCSRLLWAAVLAVSLLVLPAGANAAPDVDGAVDALISTPYDVVGDLAGGLGLSSAGLIGGTGDVVGLIDDNEYTRIVLRGLFSKTLYRFALGTSQMLTGALEGNRSEDFTDFPESADMYGGGKGTAEARMGTLMSGLGCAPMAVVDVVTGPTLMILRGVGAKSTADDVGKFAMDMRDQMVGKAMPQ